MHREIKKRVLRKVTIPFIRTLLNFHIRDSFSGLKKAHLSAEIKEAIATYKSVR